MKRVRHTFELIQLLTSLRSHGVVQFASSISKVGEEISKILKMSIDSRADRSWQAYRCITIHVNYASDDALRYTAIDSVRDFIHTTFLLTTLLDSCPGVSDDHDTPQ